MSSNMQYASALSSHDHFQQIQALAIGMGPTDALTEHISLTHRHTTNYIRDCMGTNVRLSVAVEEALLLMENNLQEPLTPRELANLIGLSRRHLERQFAACLDTSPSKIYMEIRLRYAYNLITTTRFKICQIAQWCGFSSSTSFSCLFKQKFALSPSKVRKNNPFY